MPCGDVFHVSRISPLYTYHILYTIHHCSHRHDDFHPLAPITYKSCHASELSAWLSWGLASQDSQLHTSCAKKVPRYGCWKRCVQPHFCSPVIPPRADPPQSTSLGFHSESVTILPGETAADTNCKGWTPSEARSSELNSWGESSESSWTIDVPMRSFQGGK
jgi:hypothetical protein